MNKSTTSLLLLPFLAACGDFVPATGTWSVSEVAYPSNTCGVDLTADTVPTSTTVDLAVNEDGTFSLTLEGNTESALCTFDSRDSFSCLDAQRSIELGPDAINITLSVSGLFTDDATMDLSVLGTADCVGDNCGAFPMDFPCAIDATAVATAPAE